MVSKWHLQDVGGVFVGVNKDLQDVGGVFVGVNKDLQDVGGVFVRVNKDLQDVGGVFVGVHNETWLWFLNDTYKMSVGYSSAYIMRTDCGF